MSDRLRLAVFIDFDNIEIGIKNTLGAAFDAGLVLEALKERGEVVSKMAYSDWQRAGGYSRALTQHAIRMVQRNLTPGGDKNGADINLALDALEMAFTHPHINAFVIVGGDSDFISLVEKLKQYDKKVFVVGGRQFTSGIMQRNCHEFIAYENLIGAGRRGSGGGRGQKPERADISQAIPLARRALKVMQERDVDPQLGLFKSTLLQLDSTFSERTYGTGSFREFAQRLEQAGVLRVHQGKGGWLVAPLEAGGGEVAEAAGGSTGAADEASGPVETAPVAQLGDPIEGISEAYRILTTAEVKKWPIYLRHVKQIFRAQNPPFDERAYGFASIADLLRAAHKEGAIKVERDRQGGLRIFEPGRAMTPDEFVRTAEPVLAAADAGLAEAEAPAAVPPPVEPADDLELGAGAEVATTAPEAPPRKTRARKKATTARKAVKPRATRAGTRAKK